MSFVTKRGEMDRRHRWKQTKTDRYITYRCTVCHRRHVIQRAFATKVADSIYRPSVLYSAMTARQSCVS